MKRNHKYLNQTAMHQLKSWRANVDTQFIIYKGDPFSPDSSEVARLTNYLVAYEMKGNRTLHDEKACVKDTILR